MATDSKIWSDSTILPPKHISTGHRVSFLGYVNSNFCSVITFLWNCDFQMSLLSDTFSKLIDQLFNKHSIRVIVKFQVTYKKKGNNVFWILRVALNRWIYLHTQMSYLFTIVLGSRHFLFLLYRWEKCGTKKHPTSHSCLLESHLVWLQATGDTPLGAFRVGRKVLSGSEVTNVAQVWSAPWKHRRGQGWHILEPWALQLQKALGAFP